MADDRGQRRWPKQKAALTRAIKKGHAAVVEATRKVVIEWNEDGPWPDDWSRWQRALDDTWWAERARYVRGEIDEMPPQVNMHYL